MKTALQLALEHARVYARERGGRVEPLTWEEVALILNELSRAWRNECDCEEAA